MADRPYYTPGGWSAVGSEPGGCCPVEAHGTLNCGPFDVFTRHWHFRARWDRWTLAIGKPDPDWPGLVRQPEEFVVTATFGEAGGFDASSMPDDVARVCILYALDLWATRKPRPAVLDLGTWPPNA
jgi:hypothetical protein